MIKKEHRFFERFLNNDLESLYIYLSDRNKDLVAGKIGNISEKVLSQFNEYNGAPTQLGKHYNIFSFDNKSIKTLQLALKDAIKEACEYYEIDFKAQEYKINGWFNFDIKTEGSTVTPLDHPEHFHDHMNGEGAPVFHGYYCVNAEPSSTFYKINGETLFENINLNNRAIVSETGHPHGRDDWYQNRPRVTIAYDIAPGNGEFAGSKWIDL